MGIIDGYPDGTFKPENPLKRSELIKIIKALADGGYITAPSRGTTGGTAGTTTGGTTGTAP
ncbi:hypothetical protein SD70_25965 [Gordoniibacillus kamchatkensis]|uniref:SLH domain-containing protein n=1 Tax=Gordoniibacillus kamchatkensis TaxID=1590651 RepID=A0ABR5ABS7_9BACL|nr:hypothetical protein SD70_25965 [Paenibacillus sp. VKM B-2647]